MTYLPGGPGMFARKLAALVGAEPRESRFTVLVFRRGEETMKVSFERERSRADFQTEKDLIFLFLPDGWDLVERRNEMRPLSGI